jgi:hypothetical protein
MHDAHGHRGRRAHGGVAHGSLRAPGSVAGAGGECGECVGQHEQDENSPDEMVRGEAAKTAGAAVVLQRQRTTVVCGGDGVVLDN